MPGDPRTSGSVLPLLTWACEHKVSDSSLISLWLHQCLCSGPAHWNIYFPCWKTTSEHVMVEICRYWELAAGVSHVTSFILNLPMTLNFVSSSLHQPVSSTYHILIPYLPNPYYICYSQNDISTCFWQVINQWDMCICLKLQHLKILARYVFHMLVIAVPIHRALSSLIPEVKPQYKNQCWLF